MAVKKKAATAKSLQPKTKGKAMPAGWITPIATGGAFHDFTKAKVLQGVVQGFSETPNKFGKKGEMQKVMAVLQPNGDVLKVSEAYALSGLFSEAKAGDEVRIEFLGVTKLKGKKTVKEFATAYKKKAAKTKGGKPF